MKITHLQKVLFFAISLTVAGHATAQVSAYAPKEIPPPSKKAARIAISQGPSLESFRNNEAIIRWTSENPGGTDEHYGIVRYGIDPNQLTQTARSHIRLNRNHSNTVFRVRVTDLKPATTYYYTVDSTDADGTRDGVKSPVCRFVTPKNS